MVTYYDCSAIMPRWSTLRLWFTLRTLSTFIIVHPAPVAPTLHKPNIKQPQATSNSAIMHDQISFNTCLHPFGVQGQRPGRGFRGRVPPDAARVGPLHCAHKSMPEQRASDATTSAARK